MADNDTKNKVNENQEIYETPQSMGQKRMTPYSPDDVSPSLQQLQKQAKTADSETSIFETQSSCPIGDYTENVPSISDSNIQAFIDGTESTVLNVSEIICGTTSTPKFWDMVLPKIQPAMMDAIKPTIEKTIRDTLDTLLI